MSHPWDPPDPDQDRNAFYGGRSNRSVGIVLLVITALIAGGAVSYVLSQWQDARSQSAIVPTTASTTSTTTTTIAPTTTTTIAPTSTIATTTVAPTTTFAPVVGDHMVFADGYPLGHISPEGFATYPGDPVPQLRLGSVEVSSVVNFVESQFNVQVRPLDPSETSASCPIAVQPRASDDADPLGLWVEAPNWKLQPDSFTPVAFDDPVVAAVVQLLISNSGVQPAQPPQHGSAVLVDLIGDGVPDLVVSATYSDDVEYYRLVAVAADDNPQSATAVVLEFGATFAADGSRDPLSRGELRVDGVVEMTGAPPYELFVRRTTATTKGVTIRDLTGAEVAAWECPR